MRSFLSRFTLSSVAALALGALIAGCSGSSSSSLPAANGSGATSAGPLISQPHQMTPAQIDKFNKMLAAAMKKKPNGYSSSSGIPGAFGLSTFPTGNPNALGGIQGDVAAYTVGQFSLNASAAQPDSDLYLALVSPGGNGVGAGCFIPYYVYENHVGAANNYVGWINECARPRTGVFGTLNPNFRSGTTPPVAGFRETSDATGTVWTFSAFCFTGCGIPAFFVQAVDTTGNGNTILPGNGFAGWIEEPLAAGLCKPLPNPSGGLEVNSVQYAPPGSTTFSPATAGNTIFDPPNPVVQTCFADDGSGIGSVYFVNAAGQPFFTSAGGQFIVTSIP